jgi:SAM-dependent methyltransferase
MSAAKGDRKHERAAQPYGERFARIYNLRWSGFATAVAPVIHAFYKSLPIASSNTRLLDVACGTGQLMAWFLERGYTVTGLDASEAMLAIARRNAGRYAREGKADFVRADATDFRIQRGYGLVVSTFDALNHLPDRESLGSCFASVHRILAPGGCFIFDLNTEKGLRMWNSISVEETDELFIVNRGVYGEGMGSAFMKVTGFVKAEKERYERFEQTAYNTIFSMREVHEELAGAGFAGSYFSTAKDLSVKVHSPEDLPRVFIVARRAG